MRNIVKQVGVMPQGAVTDFWMELCRLEHLQELRVFIEKERALLDSLEMMYHKCSKIYEADPTFVLTKASFKRIWKNKINEKKSSILALPSVPKGNC